MHSATIVCRTSCDPPTALGSLEDPAYHISLSHHLLSQWPMVAALTGLWGLQTEINGGLLGVLIAFDRSPFDPFS